MLDGRHKMQSPLNNVSKMYGIIARAKQLHLVEWVFAAIADNIITGKLPTSEFTMRALLGRGIGGGAKGLGGAHQRADIARIGNLVEHEDRPGAFQRIQQRRRGQLVRQQRDTLMHDAGAVPGAQQLIDPLPRCDFRLHRKRGRLEVG